jgi:Spy/CpxP family protein refolding chaperone
VEVLVPSTCGFGIRRGECRHHSKNFVTAAACVRSCLSKAQRGASKEEMKPIMKRNLLAVVAAGAIALAGFIITQAQAGSGVGCAHGHAFGLHELTDQLNLTPEQQPKVQPILDQTKPQIAAIHQEAMQKMKTVIEGAVSQIRPILTADQQTKLDGIQKAHQDMMNAQKELHDATQD